MSKPKKKTTRSKTGGRRSHIKVAKGQLVRCENCGAASQTHMACPSCGTYKGKSVVDVQKRIDRRVRKLKPIS